MPERIAGMPHLVWNMPVTKPASIPQANAHSRASHGFTPARMSMTAAAPPVAMEPSTVRSATSRIRKVMYTPMAIRPQMRPWAAAPGSELSSAERKLIIILLVSLRLQSTGKGLRLSADCRGKRFLQFRRSRVNARDRSKCQIQPSIAS